MEITYEKNIPKASPNLHMKIAFFKSFLYYLHMKLHMKKTHLSELAFLPDPVPTTLTRPLAAEHML